MTTSVRRGDRVRIRGERWNVIACAGPLVRVRGCEDGNRATEATFLTGVEQMQRVPRRGLRIVRPARWRRAARRLLADAQPSPAALRTAMRARIDLLPFQLEPALAWTHGKGVRFLIGDEVGLGKTIQAGLLVAEVLARAPGGHVLVVTPAGLREQWVDELEARFALTAAPIDSAALARLSSAVLTGANPWTVAPVSVASIDFVKRAEVLRSLEPVIWDLVVFDEAHALSGRSDRAVAARLVAERARAVMLLSATPHSGDVEAFERLVSIGDIDGRFPLVAFRRTRRDAGFGKGRRTVWLRVRLTADERKMHKALDAYTRAIWNGCGAVDASARLVAVVLARRACSSAAALARSLARRALLLQDDATAVPQLHLPFDDSGGADDATLGTPGLADRDEERRTLDRLMALASVAAGGESKSQALRRLLRRIGEPAIVFTEYRDTLEHVAGALEGLRPVCLHGGLAGSERRDVVREFTHGRTSLLLATDAASEGLNLHHRCRLVINLELPWSPVRLEQRAGRVDRLGQVRTVHAIHLVGRDTPEERTVLTLLDRLTRSEGALAAMRPAVSDDEVAAAVMGNAEVPAVASTATPPMAVGDFRAAARAETDRILRCRALDRCAAPESDDRVVVTTRRRSASACCAFRLFLDDAGNEPVWDGVIGFSAIVRLLEARVPVQVAALETALAPWVNRALAEAACSIAASAHDSLNVGLERESAISAMLRTRRARMASDLVQRGLFDDRIERAANAQAAVMETALAACERQIERLRQRERLEPAGGQLAFVALPG